MSIQNGCVLTHEGIEYLCGLIRDINGLDTNLIDDLNIKSNGTFSSVRINTLLNALKTDCNDFANSLVSNISRLELKIVTNEADIIEHNKLYLIKKAGETSYSQYVIVTNDSGVDEKILLGTTDINISDYYTITQADTKFTLKTDFNSLKTEVDKVKTTLGTDSLNTTSQTVTGGVNELKTDLTTHTNDTDIHITSAERTAWNKKANDNEVVKKTDITTTIDSSSTDTQVPSAKGVYNEMLKLGSNPNVFALGEQVVGKWIDGKTIYRRCIVNNGSGSGTNIGLSVDLSNVDRIIDFHGTGVFDSRYELPIHYVDGGSYFDVYRDIPSKRLYASFSISGRATTLTKAFIFMDYAKINE